MAQATAQQSKPIRWPRAGAAEFTFDYTSTGGPYLGPGVQERSWTVTVDSRRAECVLDRHRSDAETPGEPIGLFRFEMTDDDLRALQATIRGAGLGALEPKPGKGNPGSSLQTIDWWSPENTDPGGRTTVSFDSTDRRLSGSIWPLMERVFALLAKGLESPESAVCVEAGLKPGIGGQGLTMRLVNVGTAKACVNDPRVGVGSPDRFAVVRVAAKPATQKGVTPTAPRWTDVRIPASDEKGRPATVVLGPGEALDLGSVPWPSALPKGSAYLMHGAWSDYTGDREMDGVYRVRGAATSKWVEVTP